MAKTAIITFGARFDARHHSFKIDFYNLLHECKYYMVPADIIRYLFDNFSEPHHVQNRMHGFNYTGYSL